MKQVRSWTDLLRGILGGLIGGALFGHFQRYLLNPGFPADVVPVLYGIQPASPVIGWGIHLLHSSLMGALYVITIDGPDVRRGISPRTYRGAIFHGITCGLMLAVTLGMIVFPLWLNWRGYSGAPPVPDIRYPRALIQITGHVIFGLTVSMTYALRRH